MSVVEKRYEHICFDEHDEPVIGGTRIKVSQLVLDKLAYGWSPEELLFQHSQLTLGQIYAALAYYADHQQDMDEMLESQAAEIDKMASRIRQPRGLLKRIQNIKHS